MSTTHEKAAAGRTQKTRSRQLSRPEIAAIVIRALLSTAANDEVSFAVVGRIVARIIKAWPLFTPRQAYQVERDWMNTLKAEVAARDIAGERDARVATSAATEAKH